MDTERYNRQMLLPGFGAASQQKLFAAKVLVVGVGGLGCPALQVLAAAGIGGIGLADPDLVALDNLHRQFLFDESSVGLPKAVQAKKKLEQLNSQAVITAFQQRIDAANAFELISQYDIVMDCTDNFTTRYLLNDACCILGKPLVYGALHRYEGQVALFNVYHKGMKTNYRDLFPRAPHPGEVPDCSQAGVLPTLSALIGTMMANEVIKYSIGAAGCLVHKVLIFDSRNYQQLVLSYTENKNKECPKDESEFQKFDYRAFCGMQQVGTIGSAQELKAFLSREHAVLVDLREQEESPAEAIENRIAIPFSVLEQQSYRLAVFDHLCFACTSGTRSAKAVEMLREQFPSKELRSLEGGFGSVRL